MPESEQELAAERRLILITGTPGSGKRAVGYLLVDEWSFVHLDLDNRHANARFLGRGVEGLREELEENLEPGQDMVITWNPGSKDALPMVREMQGLGFSGSGSTAIAAPRSGLCGRSARRSDTRAASRVRASSIRSPPTGASGLLQGFSPTC